MGSIITQENLELKSTADIIFFVLGVRFLTIFKGVLHYIDYKKFKIEKLYLPPRPGDPGKCPPTLLLTKGDSE